MEEFIQEFKVESGSIIEALHGLLMSYEESTSKNEIAEELFRGIHTLKGTSKMFGFDTIEEVTHQLEDILDQCRSTGTVLSRELIDHCIHVLDYCNQVLNGTGDKLQHDKILSGIDNYLEKEKSEIKETVVALHCILYTPAEDVFARGINPISLFTELEALGDFTYFIHQESTQLETQLKNKKLDSTFDLWLSTDRPNSDVEDVFMFMKSNEYKIYTVDNEETAVQLLKEISVLNGKPLTKSQQKSRKEFIEQHQKKVLQTAKEVHVIGEVKPIEAKPPAQQEHDVKLSYVNVALPKLDQMMNLVSELVTLSSEVKHFSHELDHASLKVTAERLERASILFRDNAFSMRLVPIQILSVKLQRYVRELGTNMGKKVRFLSEGMHTEIDKAIINEIEAPLMHIIRNAMDHGFETPAERIAKGKPEECILKIAAFYSGTNAFIHIQDDGRGIDLERVRAKAIEVGLVKSNDKLSDKEIIELIFKAGFSTAAEVSAVSGRGVGMDVVKKNISNLRGSIEVTTEKDLGTSFAIRLPLALSIMDVMLVRVGTLNYMFPHHEIEICTSEKFGGGLVQKRGFNLSYKNKLLPFLNLNDLFDSKTKNEEIEKSVIILNKDDQLLSVEVDEIVGKEQVVIKPVDEALQMIPYLSGTAILGNGDLAFLIDVIKLKQLYAHEGGYK